MQVISQLNTRSLLCDVGSSPGISCDLHPRFDSSIENLRLCHPDLIDIVTLQGPKEVKGGLWAESSCTANFE